MEQTREQGNYIEQMSHLHGGERIRVRPTSPRPDCIQITLPGGCSHHVNGDGRLVHISADLADLAEML